MKRWSWLWLLCSALWLNAAALAEPLFQHGEVPRPGLGGALTLTDQQGHSFSLKQLKGQPALLFFGFSRCATVCPVALFQAKQLLALFQSRRAPTVIFISLDPLSDDPASLAKFLAPFDRRIVGLTGSPAQIEQAAARYGVAMQGQGANIEHSARWYLVGADAQVLRVYDSATSANLLAQDIVRMQNATNFGRFKEFL